MPAHQDLSLHRCGCNVPFARHSYAVDIQRRIEPLVESVIRLEHQFAHLAHHVLKDTENFVRTGHRHQGADGRSHTGTPIAALSSTVEHEEVRKKEDDDYSPPSLDGKHFQDPPPHMPWNQGPEHKHHEPMVLTIAKLEHQVRYLMHRMDEMLRNGAMVKGAKVT